MLSTVVSCPPCKLDVDVKQPAGLLINAPDCHSAPVPSKKYLSAADIFPKRVGLPSARPAQFFKSSIVAYGAPLDGTDGAADSVLAETGGTVRTIASMPSTISMPRATSFAIFAVLPLRL